MFALLRFKYLYHVKKSLSWVYNFHFCMYNKVHFNICYRFCTFIPPCGLPRWYLVLLPKRDSSSSTMPDSFFILVFLWKCSLNTSRTKEPQLTAVEPYAMPTIWSTEEETACPGSIWWRACSLEWSVWSPQRKSSPSWPFDGSGSSCSVVSLLQFGKLTPLIPWCRHTFPLLNSAVHFVSLRYKVVDLRGDHFACTSRWLPSPYSWRAWKSSRDFQGLQRSILVSLSAMLGSSRHIFSLFLSSWKSKVAGVMGVEKWGVYIGVASTQSLISLDVKKKKKKLI